MKFTPQITIAAAILALSTGGWVRNTALSVGCLSGAIATFQTRPGKQSGLTDSEVLELAIASATAQTESDLDSLEKLLATKTQELAELDHLTSEELERLSQEKRDQVQNLNRQIDELTQLLDEQLVEIDQRENEARQQLALEIEQRKFDAEAELEAKRKELEAIAQEDEAWLEAETKRLTQSLERDKADFLRSHQEECDRLLDEIDLLESELNAAYQLLEKYEEPELPRGFDREKVVAYKLQVFWRSKGIITYLVGTHPDEGNREVIVRLRPKTGGLKQFKKEWLDELQVQEDLPEAPKVKTIGGAIEFRVKPRDWMPFKPWDDSPPSREYSQSTTVNYGFENPEPVTPKELDDFQPPSFRIDPTGDIRRIEQVWVVSLWESGVRTQGLVCSTVYRSRTGNPVAKGDGSSFINARERMYCILDLQGITYIRRGA